MSAPITMPHRRYLLHFAHEHLDFRLAELTSILKLCCIGLELPSHDVQSPFMMVELPKDDDAHKIASRSVLVRSVYHLWARGHDYEELGQKLRSLPKCFLEPHLNCLESYRYTVTTFNKSLTNEEKIKRIENLPSDVLGFHGNVNLKNPAHNYFLIEYYGPFGERPPEHPKEIFFGKWVADGQRDMIREYHLQKRHFIANTSMDAGLSMIMANLGMVDRNTVIFDPFVGSGSLLVAGAHYGAYVIGTDIDYCLLHAKARPSRCNEKKRAADESIRSNLRQYGTEHLYLDALVADASKEMLWRRQMLFDAIITDPPYGIREGAKKVGTEAEEVFIDEELKASGNHFPKRLDYHLSDIFKDLLNFAAKYLNKNGRLVYWFPVSIQDYTEDNLPQHPCLRLVHNCEQKLNSRISRRLITMEKIMDYREDISDAKVSVDHFEGSTFREMYFNENKLQKEKNYDVTSTSKKMKNLEVANHI